MNNQPQQIFLQIGFNPEGTEDFNELMGVSWSDKKEHESDLPYYSLSHLSSALHDQRQIIDPLVKALEQAITGHTDGLMEAAEAFVEEYCPTEIKQFYTTPQMIALKLKSALVKQKKRKNHGS